MGKRCKEEDLEQRHITVAQLAEFERLCLSVTGVAVSISTLFRRQKVLTDLAMAFRDLIAEFEEEEAPGLLKLLRAAGLSKPLAHKYLDSTIFLRVIKECKRRNLLPCGHGDVTVSRGHLSNFDKAKERLDGTREVSEQVEEFPARRMV